MLAGPLYQVTKNLPLVVIEIVKPTCPVYAITQLPAQLVVVGITRLPPSYCFPGALGDRPPFLTFRLFIPLFVKLTAHNPTMHHLALTSRSMTP